MSQKAITIYTPAAAEPHITADDDAFIHSSAYNVKSGIIGSLTCVKVNNNTVRLSGGGVMNRGQLQNKGNPGNALYKHAERSDTCKVKPA